MTQIRDAQVMRIIGTISEHYKTHISNRFIRPALLQLPLDKLTWDHIENLTEKFEQNRYQGFHLDELYHQIASLARFVFVTREIAPNLKHRLNMGSSNSPDKVLQDMAVNNFTANLQLFADLVFELYEKVTEIDIAHAKDKRPLYQTIPELSDITNQLLNH